MRVLCLQQLTRARILLQTDDICADFEKRLKAIVPALNAAGAAAPAPRSTAAPAGSALAACAVAQAQSGSLILAATGALQRG